MKQPEVRAAQPQGRGGGFLKGSRKPQKGVNGGEMRSGLHWPKGSLAAYGEGVMEERWTQGEQAGDRDSVLGERGDNLG